MLTLAQLQQTMHQLGLSQRVILAHGALKSFGSCDFSPQQLIDTLASKGNTLVMPTFEYDCLANPPQDATNYQQNAVEGPWAFCSPHPFVGHENRITPDMGALSKILLNHPMRIRSVHPINSFTALGPQAKALMARQSYQGLYDIYQALCSDTHEFDDAVLLLMGVGLTSATPIHYAEQLAGRAMFVRWASVAGEGIVETRIGACSLGFAALDDAVATIETRVLVGESLWRLFSLKAFIAVCQQAIEKNPALIQCHSDCVRCRDIIAGGPFVRQSVGAQM
ncbi:hypothetical protein VST7929_01294 [Vibrio stylophorae]|uniref:Aminoglycoside N(3)-acetyltransferase n=1 Tax=Vibrio stylophorae TaxID=659351 RepID=A0ABM8ZT11_9VIBR|nr:AAC(3) family N-acetyltransferase [Vibrio stylophorae]CAH0533426.1 hypothetical protein VST7929_01294 [Vibrio stylophorae]